MIDGRTLQQRQQAARDYLEALRPWTMAFARRMALYQPTILLHKDGSITAGPDHPDVIAMKAQYEDLAKSLAAHYGVFSKATT